MKKGKEIAVLFLSRKAAIIPFGQKAEIIHIFPELKRYH